jgi:hypothetical protein
MGRLFIVCGALLIVYATSAVTIGCTPQPPISREESPQPLPAEGQTQKPAPEPLKEDPAVLEKIEKGMILEEELQALQIPPTALKQRLEAPGKPAAPASS